MALLPSSSMNKQPPHIVLFPFMSKGHTIPLLHLARLVLHRGVRITIVTTPANRPFITQSLPADAGVSIIDLPFPDNIPGIPSGTESTDKLPSMSLFVSFVTATKLMQPSFEEVLEKIHPHVSCIISDGFLHWTLQSSSKFSIPRLSFYGMGYYAMTVSSDAGANGLLTLHESGDEPFTLTSFPWIKITRNEFNEPFDKLDPRGPFLDFVMEAVIATANSYGLLMNSFYELEQPYVDHWNRRRQPKAWSVGPLCLARSRNFEPSPDKPKWIHWLDQKLSQGSPVLYIAFGSQANISPPQLHEIALGLEEAKVNFLWVMKKNTELVGLSDGFEDRARDRGIMVYEWVDQTEILEHPIVRGFLSHCGWNSVLEGVCAGVPILAWPMMADQHLNAKMVVEEIKVGLRVNTVDGSARGFVSRESVKNAVMELMEGEKGRMAREKVKEVAEAATRAMADGGSSWQALNNLINEMHKQEKIDVSEVRQ